ncbi:hypothetical protein CMO88_02925 [Candidatus Woesearchaeota archaeon]|nr:hypothetical protein [Candidatus Woesearchaeota archaeon]|tara:strand:- start:9332 stop:10108 length:777 start_codon:yes stop_codon:yes gene_type:complete
MNTTLIKLGGSVITKKSEAEPVLNKQNLSRISEEIASSLQAQKFNLVIVHGAGSYGHPISSKHKLAQGISDDFIPVSKCQALMNELNSFICKELNEKNIPAFPFQLSSTTTSTDGKIIINTDLINNLLSKRMVPVLFGTPAIDDNKGCSIISGDQIISNLSSQLNASKVVFATNVDGMFTADPSKENSELLKSLSAEQLKEISAEESKDADVTGGMKGKLEWILKMSNLTCQVVNGNTQNNIKEALLGNESIGTVIKL